MLRSYALDISRLARWSAGSILLCALAACTGDDDTGPTGVDTDDNTDTDTDITDTDQDTGTVQGFDSSFVAGRYRMTELRLATSADTNQDGEDDNNLANVLNLVDALLAAEDLSPETFNVRMQENLDSYVTVVLMDARYIDLELEIDMLQGDADENLNLTINQASYDDNGDPRVQFQGIFTSEDLMWAETEAMTFPVAFAEGMESLPVTLEQGYMEGRLTEDEVTGTLTGALPIDELLDKVVEPMIPDGGYDYDNDGDLDSQEDIMALIEGIAPQAGDVDLGGGRSGVSSVFTFEANPATWAR